MKTKLHYRFFKLKNPTTRDKEHSEFHFEFRPWDGGQMVGT